MPVIGDEGLQPTVARTLAANSTSANVALTATCRRVLLTAHTADIYYKIGPGAQTATSSDHLLVQNERLLLTVPKGANIAAIRHAGNNGVMYITELA